MCKYCMLTWADDSYYNYSEDFLAKSENGINITLRIENRDNNPAICVNAWHGKYNPDKTLRANTKIHYCPFCGQKLDLVEVTE